MYLKLTNKQLDLAGSFERWQMEKFGNVIPESNFFAPGNDKEIREANKIEEINLSKSENLNHEYEI